MKNIKFTEKDFQQYREFFEEHIGRHARIHIGGVGKCVDVKVVSVSAPKKLLYYVPLHETEGEIQTVFWEQIFGHESLGRQEKFQREQHPVYYRNAVGELTPAIPNSPEAGYRRDPANGYVLTKL